jgi:RHS repeat-associated protein
VTRAPATTMLSDCRLKFTGKERDTESGLDNFGARYYSNHFGRWLSSDWSAVPVPVPYANLTNPQTLNLYSMTSDDPESFADLDGHISQQSQAGGGCSQVGGACLEEEIQPAPPGLSGCAFAGYICNGPAQETKPTMQLQVDSSTVATDKKDGNPNITADSIFQVKVSVSDVKDGSVRLSASLQTPDGKSISGPRPIIGLREGSDARLVPEGSKSDHGSLGRTAVIGIAGNVNKSQTANLVFTLSQGKNVIASAAQPVHLLQGSASHSPGQMSSVVGGSRNYVDFGVP